MSEFIWQVIGLCVLLQGIPGLLIWGFWEYRRATDQWTRLRWIGLLAAALVVAASLSLAGPALLRVSDWGLLLLVFLGVCGAIQILAAMIVWACREWIRAKDQFTRLRWICYLSAILGAISITAFIVLAVQGIADWRIGLLGFLIINTYLVALFTFIWWKSPPVRTRDLVGYIGQPFALSLIGLFQLYFAVEVPLWLSFTLATLYIVAGWLLWRQFKIQSGKLTHSPAL